MTRFTRTGRVLMLSVLAWMPLVEGCTSYHALRPGTPQRPSTPLRVVFGSPQELRAISTSHDTVRLRNVLELTGMIDSASGDTLSVRLLTVNRRVVPAADARVRIVPASGDRFETQQVDALMTLTVAAVVLVLAAGAALAIAFSGYSGD